MNGGKWQRVKLPRGAWQKTFCADPFLFRHNGENYLFFETMTEGGKGILGCSKQAKDKWVWQGIALEESCHLSYPQVFEEEGRIYMIPESCDHGKGDVRLYEAEEFPLKWKKVETIIPEPFADSTILKYEDHWYLACYAGEPKRRAELWHAPSLRGPWSRHPQSSNITQTFALMRCGGFFLREEGKLYRVAQDCDGYYGIRLWKVPVEELSPTRYREGEASLLIGENDEPKAMKHTYNRIAWSDTTLEVIDTHHDVMHPFNVLVHNFKKAILKK